MKRRQFLASPLAVVGLAAPRRRRLTWCGLPSTAPDVDGVARKHWAQMLVPHGFILGGNLEIDVVRPSVESPSPNAEWEAIAREVVTRAPDVALVNYNWVSVFRPLTRELPIVFVGMIDPEYHGSIASARRPGGNITGALVPFFEAQEKKVELLKLLRPGARRVAAVLHSGAYDGRIQERIADLGRRLGMEGFALPVDDSARDGSVASALRNARADLADLLIADRLMHPATHAQLVTLGIACSVQYSGTVRAGALLAYEPEGVEEIAVDLAARILRGERVATMPARQADRIRLSINLRTARALGITVPKGVLVQAHDVFD